MLTVTVNATGTPYRFELKARSHTQYTDAPSTYKGKLKGGDTGPTPHEMMLWSISGCTGITMAMKAAVNGWDLQDIQITVTEDTILDPEGSGKKIPRITEDITLIGNLSAQEIADLKKAGAECPVHTLFEGKKVVVANVTHVVPAGNGGTPTP